MSTILVAASEVLTWLSEHEWDAGDPQLVAARRGRDTGLGSCGQPNTQA